MCAFCFFASEELPHAAHSQLTQTPLVILERVKPPRITPTLTPKIEAVPYSEMYNMNYENEVKVSHERAKFYKRNHVHFNFISLVSESP